MTRCAFRTVTTPGPSRGLNRELLRHLKCCGGRLADDPIARWWVALHEPGCASAWQSQWNGQRPDRALPRWNRARSRPDRPRHPGRCLATPTGRR